MEENEYKYLVDVCNLADDMSISCNSGCSPDDRFRYTITVRHTTKAVRNTFYNMVIRKEDDILYCLNHYVNRVLELVNLGNFDPIHNTFDLDFIGTEYSLDSEFAKGLKRINSLDDIEKSHVDEPGELGEQGVGPAVLLNIIEELDLCMPLVIQPGGRAIAEVCCNKKLADFHRKYDSCRVIFRVDIGDDVRYYVVEREGEVVIDSFTWILKEINYKEIPLMHCSGQLYKSPLQVERDGDNVLFSVPTLAGARDTKPLQPGMLTYTDTADAGSKDETVCTKQKSLSEALLEMYPSVKSTFEREMDLIQRYKINSDLFEREEAPKFPQMRRARLNKPKSI